MARLVSRPLLLACGLASIAILLGLSKSASARAELPSIEYRAPSGCPNETEYRAHLQQRLDGVDAKADFSLLRVSVEQHENEFIGRLLLRGINGSEATRELNGPVCAEVVDGLSLLAAIAIGLVPPESEPSTSIVGADVVRPIEQPIESGRWRVGAGADAIFLWSLGPQITPGPQAFVEFARASRSVFAPTARARFAHVQSVTFDSLSGAGTASFELTTGQLELSPLRLTGSLSRHHKLALLPAAGIRAGVIKAFGKQIVGGHDETRGWISLEMLARAEWQIVDRLFVEIEGGASVPLMSYRFYFLPNNTVYEMPKIGGIGAAGMGVRFP